MTVSVFDSAGRPSLVTIAVSCTSEPRGLELTGSTPTEIALPEVNVSDTRISKAGYQAWHKRVHPREGMQISVELAPSMPEG